MRAVSVCASPVCGTLASPYPDGPHRPRFQSSPILEPGSGPQHLTGDAGPRTSLSASLQAQAALLHAARARHGTGTGRLSEPSSPPLENIRFSRTSYCCLNDNPENYFHKEFTWHNHPSVTWVPVGPVCPHGPQPPCTAPRRPPSAPAGHVHARGAPTSARPPRLLTAVSTTLVLVQIKDFLSFNDGSSR